jgi:hypothetical protein
LQAKSSRDCNSRSMRSTKMMFVRANNCGDSRKSERSRWCSQERAIKIMFARANDYFDREDDLELEVQPRRESLG